MIRILYLYEHLEIGGAEQLFLTILKYLNRDKFLPIIYCIGEKGGIGKEIEKLSIQVRSLGKNTCLCNISILFSLVNILRRERPDVLHTNLFLANIYGRLAAKISGVDTVITSLHNPDYSYEDNGRITYKIRKAIDKFTGYFCNSCFIAVSDFVKNDFEKHLGFKNVVVLHNCIDDSRFKKLGVRERTEKRQEIGFKDGDVILLNVARLHPQKGHLFLVDLFKIIHEKDKRYKLIIIGNGTLEKELKDKIAFYGLEDSIKLLKDRRDIPELMSACDIFILPSLYEGFGIVIAEAMASGIPIVANDIPTLREIISDKIDGLLVEMKKENSEAITKTICSLVDDQERRFSIIENARLKAAQMFGAKQYIKKLEDIYDNALRTK